MLKNAAILVFYIGCVVPFTRSSTFNSNGTDTDSSDEQTCTIRSIKYSAYLSASNKKDNFLKQSNDPFFDSFSNNRKVFASDKLISSDRIEWVLVPYQDPGVSEKSGKNLFMIKNAKLNEYLCSSPFHSNDIFKWKRMVYTHQMHEGIDTQKCIWYIQSIKKQPLFAYINKGSHHTKEKEAFLVWNLFYKQALFVSSSLLRPFWNARDVYTWHQQPDSEIFLWDISCSFAKHITS
jgi:hypothetical protein